MFRVVNEILPIMLFELGTNVELQGLQFERKLFLK